MQDTPRWTGRSNLPVDFLAPSATIVEQPVITPKVGHVTARHSDAAKIQKETRGKNMNGRNRLWVPGDWNAFFGFGTNILVNLLTLTALLRFVLKMPDALVFGRILPATGLMMCLSTMYYAFLAYRLAKKTGRTDVCALPSGISVPHMFIVTFVIMLPIALRTGDPIKGWEAGLTWVFVQSFVLMAGGFIAPIIRKITPRAALLGTLAGVSITSISMR